MSLVRRFLTVQSVWWCTVNRFLQGNTEQSCPLLSSGLEVSMLTDPSWLYCEQLLLWDWNSLCITPTGSLRFWSGSTLTQDSAPVGWTCTLFLLAPDCVSNVPRVWLAGQSGILRLFYSEQFNFSCCSAKGMVLGPVQLPSTSYCRDQDTLLPCLGRDVSEFAVAHVTGVLRWGWGGGRQHSNEMWVICSCSLHWAQWGLHGLFVCLFIFSVLWGGGQGLKM
jgi:hypothetical protein